MRKLTIRRKAYIRKACHLQQELKQCQEDKTFISKTIYFK